MSFSVSPDDATWQTRPFVDGSKVLRGGLVISFEGHCVDVTSPIIDQATGNRTIIGRLAQMTAEDASKAASAARAAWNNGRGEWPQMSLEGRINAINNLVGALKTRRSEIVNTLMWEICKNSADAAAEFDRTALFIESTIAALREENAKHGGYRTVSGITAKVRRAAIGVMLALGPFNYPVS
jgi:glyceraldehyde-3-phosphate dehydrogenase (NADP+)